MNGHKAPELAPAERQKLRAYVEQGGVIFAEARAAAPSFDRGFRRLIKELFPDQEAALRPLPGDHPIWWSRHRLDPERTRCWASRGFPDRGDLLAEGSSCYWNQAERVRGNPAVIQAVKVGENVVDYVTGRELPRTSFRSEWTRNPE